MKLLNKKYINTRQNRGVETGSNDRWVVGRPRHHRCKKRLIYLLPRLRTRTNSEETWNWEGGVDKTELRSSVTTEEGDVKKL